MGDLVEVASVSSEHEAVVVQALLEQGGIPSLHEPAKRNGPKLDFLFVGLGSGPRRVMVHAHRAAEARAILDEAQPLEELPPGSDPAA